MTASDDFIPGDPNFEAAPTYPVVFGVALTPMLSGVLLAIVGIGAATYLLLNYVQPEWEKYQALDQKVTDKKDQVNRQGEILKEIAKAKEELDAAKRKRSDVLGLFANESTFNTLLLDINRQIDQRNGEATQARQAKLAACPAWVRSNLREVENQVGELSTRAALKKFTPDPKASGVINDGTYGALVNNKLKRQIVTVSLEGTYNQTQSIMRSIERLQPLLVFKNFELAQVPAKGGRLFESQGNTIRFLNECQPDAKLVTTFQLEALQPLTDADRATIAPSPTPTTPPKK
jgi:type IV pilus assembly protein PilO